MRRKPATLSIVGTEAARGADTSARCETFVGMLRSSEKAVAERAARALKKIAQRDRQALLPWRKVLIAEALRAEDVRVQWNLTIVLGTLPLKGRDRALLLGLMFERLQDDSGLNRTFALQVLWDLSDADAALRGRVVPIATQFLQHGTPAMRARARKLLRVPQTL